VQEDQRTLRVARRLADQMGQLDDLRDPLATWWRLRLGHAGS
jgi:hypothetical protein